MKLIKKVHGPYLRRQDNRNIVIVMYTDGSRKTYSYARFLMEQKLGRELAYSEEVDHINGDRKDDKIENLQVLSKGSNIKKMYEDCEYKKSYVYHFICPVCLTQATSQYRNVKGNWKKGKSGPFCSKNCSGHYSSLGLDSINRIKEIRGRMSKSVNETVLKTVGHIDLEGSSPSAPTSFKVSFENLKL